MREKTSTILLSIFASVAAAPTAEATPNCTVTLQKQTSITRCPGNFGCGPTNNTMWAGNGCRGYFVCNGHKNVYCGDGFGKKLVCPCVSGPPPPPPPPPPPLWPFCGVTGIDPKTGTCYQPCPIIPNQTSCAASPYACVWQGGKCSNPLPCRNVTGESACAASPYKSNPYPY